MHFHFQTIKNIFWFNFTFVPSGKKLGIGNLSTTDDSGLGSMFIFLVL